MKLCNRHRVKNCIHLTLLKENEFPIVNNFSLFGILSISNFIFIAPNVDHRFCQHHQPSTISATTTNFSDQDNKEIILDQQALIEYVNKDGHYDDTLCNVFRAGISNKSKISSYGFLATFLNCSVIVGFTEQPCSEGSKYDSLS